MSNPTLSISNPTHGIFTVDVDHLNMSLVTRFNRTEQVLSDEVHALLGLETDIAGVGPYSDLTRIELLVVISYLTGGSVS